MITRLRFKNWRSLKDVTIDNLTPITVFIGENASGKTNLLDALYFFRESTQSGVLRALQVRGDRDEVRTLGVGNEPIELEMTLNPSAFSPDFRFKYSLEMRFDKTFLPDISEKLENQNGNVLMNIGFNNEYWIVRDEKKIEFGEHSDVPFGWEKTALSQYGSSPLEKYLYKAVQLILFRWQLLGEGFVPPHTFFATGNGGLTIIEKYGENLPLMLDYLIKVEPEIYKKLEMDMRSLIEHIDSIKTEHNELKTAYSLTEIYHTNDAPTISAGTSRLLAILTAFYVLDVRLNDVPGLVVIEEPDTALNPGILRKFVGLLRKYTEDAEHPRQVLLTTHNPAFLDYFEPEEVRIVERDEDGYTQVRPISDEIKDIWFKDGEYRVGEVWEKNVFGGQAE